MFKLYELTITSSSECKTNLWIHSRWQGVIFLGFGQILSRLQEEEIESGLYEVELFGGLFEVCVRVSLLKTN